VDEDILGMILAFVGSMALLGCVTAITMAMIRRRSARLPDFDMARRLDDIAERLSRIDGAVDTMSVEVERISEAQRFTTRVLAERATVPQAQIAERNRIGSTTPH
jgi:hypothetical protein